MKNFITPYVLIIAGLFCFTGATAQYTQSAKVVSANRESRAEYGTSVAIHGDYAVVGASRENVASGNAYVYHKDSAGTWSYSQTFSAPDPNDGAEFGGGAKISDNQLVIAAGRADVDGVIRAGALYVYSLNGNNWDYDTKLTANDYSGDAKMGMNPTSLAMENDIVVAGAPGENGWTGSVYIFEKSAGVWSQSQKLMNPNAQSGESFGIAVAINDNYIIVGSNEEDGTKGAAHIFTKDGNGTWSHFQKIVASDGTSQAYFGSSVSMDNGIIAVGAYGDNGGTGATYMFEDDGSGNWIQTEKLTASSPSTEAMYGWNCKLQNNYLVVAAPHAYGVEEGEVYFYSREAGVWNEVQKVESQDLAPEDFYGWNVEMYGDQLIVGAPWEDEDANGQNTIDRAGSAYIFENPSLAINAIDTKAQLSVYPVPAKGQVTISSNGNLTSITVVNQLGAVVKNQTRIDGNEYVLDISNYATGIYFLRIKSDQGETINKKIVVSN
jgi:hypothetical protein